MNMEVGFPCVNPTYRRCDRRSLITSKQLRFVLPDVRGYVARPTYLSFDFSLDLIIVFLRSDFGIVLTI
jgi:hypothetical protein